MTVHLPVDLEEALALRVAHPEAKPIAGGTDLGVHWPRRMAESPQAWLDLSAVKELRAREWTGDALILGAGATYWDVIADPRIGAEFPLLVRAARRVGAVQIQARDSAAAADGAPGGVTW